MLHFYFCEIEGVDVLRLHFLSPPDLQAHAPCGKVSALGGVEEITLRVIWVLPSHFIGLLTGEVLDALLWYFRIRATPRAFIARMLPFNEEDQDPLRLANAKVACS